MLMLPKLTHRELFEIVHWLTLLFLDNKTEKKKKKNTIFEEKASLGH